jgi:Cu2+-exporting ATPase
MPDNALMVHGDDIMEVKTQVQKRMTSSWSNRGKIAADGAIIEGESYLNESLLTGESKPVERRK